MPNTGRLLPLACPKCHHVGCTLVVKGITVITGSCTKCRHTWATDILSLPRAIQSKVIAALSDS